MHEAGSSRRYYLGVDGGQSSTTALIADDQGRILGAGNAGPCNHVTGAEAKAKFIAVVGDCVNQAIAEANLGPLSPQFAVACFGFSGGAEDKETYSRELISSERYKFMHDAAIALTGATEGQPGIVVIAGTGSIAYGRNASERTARAGGWGYLYGDEGGAFDIVRRALRAVLQFEEGWGPATNLHGQMLKATNTGSANELLHRFYAMSRHEIAAFAPLITAAGEAGDRVALGIIEEAASALAWYVEGVFRNLFADSCTATVAYIGGVFQSSILRNCFAEKLRLRTGCEATAPKLSPAAGALLEALRLDENESTLSSIPQIKS